ncbi:hypothetical protein N0V90_006142 [Kalmusia sp. IMI 367209]|nr:hypothetical protein N0V90_006142 [Kalmusia sp. IMI 367209]
MATKTGLPFDVKPSEIARKPPGMTDPKNRHIWNPVQKDWAHFEKYGRETGGEYSMGTASIAPGGQNGAHWHGSYSETFTSLKGSVGVFAKSQGKFILEPGNSFTVKPGEVHYFFNPGEDEVEIQIKVQPAREGFERGLYIMYGLARDGKGGNAGVAKSIMDTAIICSMSDMWPAGFVGGALTPALKALAWVGRITGKEEKLLKKYWA